jgi:hypothetical protein
MTTALAKKVASCIFTEVYNGFGDLRELELIKGQTHPPPLYKFLDSSPPCIVPNETSVGVPDIVI